MYSFVVYMYLIVSVDCIGFDHTLFIILYSAIQLFFAASMSINVQYSVRSSADRDKLARRDVRYIFGSVD